MFTQEYYGPGKYFPGGPRCTFRGINVPCYVTYSSKGSITSEILAEVLKWSDDMKVFPWDNNSPTPFLLLDRHGSRLEMPFLQYVNKPKAQVGSICIGCPNSTSLWQVGDSPEQNGCFKMYCSETKKENHKRKNSNMILQAKFITYRCDSHCKLCMEKVFCKREDKPEGYFWQRLGTIEPKPPISSWNPIYQSEKWKFHWGY